MTAVVDHSQYKTLTQHLSVPRISEVILKTRRFDEMKHWYTMVLGAAPFFERKPSEHVDPKLAALGRANDRRICFIRLMIDYPYTQVFGLFEVPEVELKPGTDPGLDHFQLRNQSLAQLIERYELLKKAGLKPYRTANHGPGTSIYYHDPDGNRVELSGANFATEAEYLDYFKSESYRRNPSGIEIDIDEYVGRFKSGVPLTELVKIPI